jgi:serine/threonine protein kinase
MLGRYQVLKPLAKGGMAEVLLARTIGLGGFARHVVIKRIRVEHGSDQKQIDMFLDEARLVAALHHRNIVQVHDIGEEDGKYFIVMEYVHGRDTRELLKTVKDNKAQIPLEHVITIVTAAAAGLHYAHEQRGADRKPLGIVHRDISPGNILLGFDGGVKVVDFGIAKAAQRMIDTQAGEMKGKVGYMSPEQCKMQPLDRRTDVFLLGIVLYELVTVRRLFKADTRYATMSQIVDGAVPSPSAARSDLPPELERIMLKALAKTPEERFQTADELRVALEAFAKSAGLTISPNALSDYLKEQFGEVPEPWHVDEAVPHPPAEVIERIRNSSQLIAVQRPSQPMPAAKPIETVEAPAAPAAQAATKSTQPELEAIKAAKPVVAGEPAGPDPELEAEERASAAAAPAAAEPAADTPAVAKPAPDKPAADAAVKTPARSYASGPAVYPTAPSSGMSWLWFVLGALVLVGGGVAVYLFVLRPELADKSPPPPSPVEQPAVAPEPAAPPDAAVAPVEDAPGAAVEAVTPTVAPAIDAGVVPSEPTVPSTATAPSAATAPSTATAPAVVKPPVHKPARVKPVVKPKPKPKADKPATDKTVEPASDTPADPPSEPASEPTQP